VEPGNTDLIHYTARCEALRADRQPTLPSRIGLERQINPFLRTREPGVQQAARGYEPHADDESSVLGALRSWKNNFK
jgi:hydroxyacylglutathione hydrolase